MIVRLLMSSSPVFDAMFEAGDASEHLELTDPDIEKSSVLSFVLDLLHGKEVDVSWRGSANCRAPRIVQALQKYDCKGALTLLRLLIRNETLSGRYAGMRLFEAAVALDDLETCHALICDAGSWTDKGYIDRDEIPDQSSRGVASPMNPANWTTLRFERMPVRVTRALLRGIETERMKSASGVDWEAVADEFKRILEDSSGS